MPRIRLVKKITILLILIIPVSFILVQTAYCDAKPIKQSFNTPELKIGETTICPVMKNEFKVEKDSEYALVDRKKYYVCCPDCIDKIKNNPEKYLKDNKEDASKQTYKSKEVKVGETTICPVMKNEFKVEKDSEYALVDRKKYYVCCPDCIDKIKNNPEKYLKDNKEDASKQTYKSKEVKVGDTTMCPVKGTKFTVKKDSKYALVDETKYYVCCPMCIDKIKKNPDKYLTDPSHHKKKQSHKEHGH